MIVIDTVCITHVSDLFRPCRRVQCSSSLHDADDWTALRKQALGAAARGAGDPDDKRLIAGARCWLALVDDHAAEAILRRPTVRHDPLAIALDTLATTLADDPDTLRRRTAPRTNN